MAAVKALSDINLEGMCLNRREMLKTNGNALERSKRGGKSLLEKLKSNFKNCGRYKLQPTIHNFDTLYFCLLRLR